MPMSGSRKKSGCAALGCYALHPQCGDPMRVVFQELKAEINNLRKLESAAPTVRAKERQLKAMEPGGAEHIPRPFVNKRKFSFRFPAAKRSSQARQCT